MLLVGDGMEVVNLADPTMPALLATVPSSGDFFRSALLRGDLAYIGTADGVDVWDLSNLTNPVAGTEVDAPADRTELAAVHTTSGGDEAVLLTGMGQGLTLGLATPAAPTLEQVFDLPAGTDVTDVATSATGEVAATDFYSGLRIGDSTLGILGRVEPVVHRDGFETGDLSNWSVVVESNGPV